MASFGTLILFLFLFAMGPSVTLSTAVDTDRHSDIRRLQSHCCHRPEVFALPRRPLVGDHAGTDSQRRGNDCSSPLGRLADSYGLG